MNRTLHALLAAFLIAVAGAGSLSAQTGGIHAATLSERDSGTPNISTDELIRLMRADSVLVLDTRPHLEWSMSHIPGARNVAPKPGMPQSQYTSDVAEIGRLVNGDKRRPLVLYCNGPYCGKSRRVATDLLAAGYTNVRRYQLGVPVWRALGGIMVIEPDGARHVFEHDRTAVWLDVRDSTDFVAGSLRGARNLPASGLRPGKDQGEVKAAKDDGRLPMNDHNTRIIVFGKEPTQVRAVAEALAMEAFHNVAMFEGSLAELRDAVRETGPAPGR